MPDEPQDLRSLAEHIDEAYRRGFEDGQRTFGGAIIPSVEDLAEASSQHWEVGNLGATMTEMERDRHHELYCMVEAKKWHDRLRRVMERPQLG
jgi:hypothetical protein